MCEFVNRFPADRRKVEVSLFSVDFETGHVGGQVVYIYTQKSPLGSVDIVAYCDVRLGLSHARFMIQAT